MKLFSLTLLVVAAFAGCRTQLNGIECVSDNQCDYAAARGICVYSRCGLPSGDCPSGYKQYQGSACLSPPDDMAGVGGGETDMAMPEAPPDMARGSVGDDMALIPDMVLTCAQQGGACSVGTGACARTGTIVCNAPNMPTCNATAGAPDTGWHTSPAVNGSWDWDCDGQVQYQYPSGTATQPYASYDTAICTPSQPRTKDTCNFGYWVYDSSTNGCGTAADELSCQWSDSLGFCNDGPTLMRGTIVGCH